MARICEAAKAAYGEKFQPIEAERVHAYERAVLLQAIDLRWREHLAALDHLRHGIHLRSYAQKNPKQEYKLESFALFGDMLDTIKTEVTRTLCLVVVQQASDVDAVTDEAEPAPSHVEYHHADYDEALAQDKDADATVRRQLPKVGRNDPCPCGSGKKYKQCHGQLA
jgi:preprotein translocase subunit SecA